MTWHVLDANSIWIREFAAALTGSVTATVCAWTPQMSWTGCLRSQVSVERLENPRLDLQRFPLQRGYARFPFSFAARLGPVMRKRLRHVDADESHSPLICTTPYYAPVAKHWAGPVIYYQTDLTVAYAGVDPAQVRGLDRELVRRADLVCPNSTRIADYFRELGCETGKIVVIPNATRGANLLAAPALTPAALPDDVADLPRPVIGVIGNLAANIDWLFLSDLIAQTPEFSWLLVGPYAMEVPDAAHRKAREAVLARGGRVRCVGARPYGALQSYARSFDAAVLPYRKQEPTYSGSSTRFYEHLAAGRPMVSTRGFEELLHREPLLALADQAGEAATTLTRWAARGFCDGHETERWQASRSGTWEFRADTMISAFGDRLHLTGLANTARSGPSFDERRTA